MKGPRAVFTTYAAAVPTAVTEGFEVGQDPQGGGGGKALVFVVKGGTSVTATTWIWVNGVVGWAILATGTVVSTGTAATLVVPANSRVYVQPTASAGNPASLSVFER